MTLDIREINRRVKEDAEGFVTECEAEYDKKVYDAALQIADGVKNSCVVLLSGPSGSGKTTTAMKIACALADYGVGTHSISMDDYFRTVDFDTAPRTEEGNIDYESPMCLDISLLKEHIAKIAEGEEVMLPKFNFAKQKRGETMRPLRLKKNEIVIFEGIHALNDMITHAAGNHGIKLYISARSNFELDGQMFFKGTWMRLARRIVRDELFRGTRADFTLGIWDSIRRGEKTYISPFKNKADIIIDSTHPYEMNMLKKHILEAMHDIKPRIPRYQEILMIQQNIEEFYDLSDDFVPKSSMLREFIGGGNFNY